MKDELPTSSLVEFILWLLRQRKRFRVTGNSMLPWLQPGEEVLVNFSAYRNALPEIGDLVVAIHPHTPNLPIIKRVIVVREDGSCFLLGDNSTESTDSRSFGVVSPSHILGKVTSRFA